MVLSDAQEVGRIIGSLVNENVQIKEDHVPGAIDESLILNPIDTAKVTTTTLVYKRLYSSTAFIIDHPIYGDVDSSTLHIDGDYLTSQGTTFPMTFTFTFLGVEPSKILWDTYTG